MLDSSHVKFFKESKLNAINQTELAKKLGVSRQYIQAVFSRKMPVGAKMAKKLEEVTCVNRLAWLYPEEYPNPFFVETKSGSAE
jgi:hypothetical protein